MNASRLFSFAALAVVLSAAPVIAQESGIAVGTRAPAFTLKDTKGVAVNLADVIGKKPIVMEFWATWCPNCKALESSLIDMHKKYGAQVAFYGVAVPINQTLDRVQRYVERYKYPFPMLWDELGAAAELYEVAATSYIVVIDKTGKVVYTGVGGEQNLDAAIRKGL